MIQGKGNMAIRKALLKLATSASVLSLLTGLSAQLAYAEHLNFTLYNGSRKTIYYLYVSATGSPLGQDVLGSGVLESGGSTRITFPNQSPESPCTYNVKVVFADGTEVQDRFNLCESDSVTVR
jgi:hypothetical protein